MSNEVDNVLLVCVTVFTHLNCLKAITSQVEAKHFGPGMRGEITAAKTGVSGLDIFSQESLR